MRQAALALDRCRGPARRGRRRGAAASSCPRRSARPARSGRRPRWPRSMASRMTNVPISRVTPARRRIDISRPADAWPQSPARGRGASASSARSRLRRGAVRSAGQAGAALPAASSVQRAPAPALAAGHRRAGSPRRPCGPARAAAGTTSRSGSSARRRRSAGPAARSAGTARRCAGRRRGAPASSRRRRARCSRRSRAAPLDRLGQDAADRVVEAPLVGRPAASRPSAADGAATATAPRRRRCCRRRPRTTGRAAAT